MKVSATSKSIMLGTMAISAIGLAIGLFLVPDPLFYAIGVALGCAMSVLKTWLLERTVNRLLDSNPDDLNNAKNMVRLGYSSRYLLTGIVLVVAVLVFGTWGLIGTFVGTLAMTIAAFATKIFIKSDTI